MDFKSRFILQEIRHHPHQRIVLPIPNCQMVLTHGRAHWYVAIICNLDNAKPRPPAAQKAVTRTRTRSQLDKTTPEPIDLDLDLDMDIDMAIDISPAESITPLIPSRHTTPAIALDNQEPQNDVPDAQPPSSSTAGATAEDVIMASGDDVIDVDDPALASTSMAQDFRRMSISSHPTTTSPPPAPAPSKKDYHYTTDSNIDPATRAQIENALEEDKPRGITRYTRSATTIKPSPEEISLDDVEVEQEEPDSISSALKQKYTGTAISTSTSTLTNRRTSGKVVPLDSYSLYPHPQKKRAVGNCRPVIIVFDSLGLRHVGTIKLLREYIVEEARSKRQIDLPKEDVSGLHAKVLPLPISPLDV